MAFRDHLRGLVVVLAVLDSTITTIGSQNPPRSLAEENALVNRTIVSPEMLPGGRVIFRIHAPKAAEVVVAGDWLRPAEPVPLTRNEQGVWSATIGPLTPDYYIYWFRVDGVLTPDPRNSAVTPAFGGATHSVFFVPGADTDFMENKSVPHGEVRQVWYQSSTFGKQRRMHVYTPPGYDVARDRYPVLYLLHGGVGDGLDSVWSGIGRAGFILDNLLATRSALPMLIVMPEVPSQPARDRFNEELLTDIVPYVEKHYRIRTEHTSRALAGFSVGGYQTLQMFTTHPESFAYFAVWSAPVEPKTVSDFGKEQRQFLSDATNINKLVKNLSFRIGSEDMGAPHVNNLTSLLREHEIEHSFTVTGGGHRWQNWRRYLHQYAQEIFR